MQIILWRHAEAEDGTDDLARRLTKKGQQQAKAAAKWLAPRLPENVEIWTSEAARSQETAMFLHDNFTVYPALNPACAPAQILQLWRTAGRGKNLVIVGHQPWIGQICAYFLSGYISENPLHYWSVKKGMFWWLEVDAEDLNISAKTLAVLGPQML